MVIRNINAINKLVSRDYLHKSTILSMRNFDDIEFLNGGVHPRYAIHLDRTPEVGSLELCSEGGMYHQRGDGQRLDFAGPAVFWHRPGQRYRYGPLAQPGWWYHQWVMFRGPRIERILADALEPLSVQHAVAIADAAALHRLFAELVGLVHAVRRRQGEAVAVLERIVAELSVAAAPPMVHAGAVEAVASAITTGPFAVWDWGREARRLGMSEAHFRRVFRAVVGAPPARHLLSVRMRAVGERLLADRRPVHVVAAALGFADQAVFTRSFARVHGLTPHRWRTMHAVPPIGG